MLLPPTIDPSKPKPYAPEQANCAARAFGFTSVQSVREAIRAKTLTDLSVLCYFSDLLTAEPQVW